MMIWPLFAAAILLSLERIVYVWAWRFPESFLTMCYQSIIGLRGTPIEVLQRLFYGFKVIQAAVFLGWCYVYGQSSPALVGTSAGALALASILILVGQILNLSVFYQLGTVGVFYGCKFGYHVPWCQEFPFSLFSHPQYVGTLLSIWGFFLLARFPHGDWYVLPILETVYYVCGAYLEQ